MGNRLSAAADPMQGQVTEERKTLGEVNEAMGGASDRLAMTAHLIDSMAIRPLALRAVSNAQQFYTLDQWVRLLGSDAEIDPQGLGRLQITAQDLEGNFDYKALSPVTAEDPVRQVAVWQGLFQSAMQTPQLFQPDPLDPTVLSVKKLFKYIASIGGAREIDQMFQAMPQMMGPGGQAPQVMPDEAVQQQVQAGNLVPMGQPQ
jgi:hypothetical protein